MKTLLHTTSDLSPGLSCMLYAMLSLLLLLQLLAELLHSASYCYFLCFLLYLLYIKTNTTAATGAFSAEMPSSAENTLWSTPLEHAKQIRKCPVSHPKPNPNTRCNWGKLGQKLQNKDPMNYDMTLLGS